MSNEYTIHPATGKGDGEGSKHVPIKQLVHDACVGCVALRLKHSHRIISEHIYMSHLND